ncbi:protein XRI1-like [Magnolia sinica]|uniref:protein XRI1-like n=1 Tax=Magnolia sinica TaxID=86752 RepID=UPI0026595208|nr:protein XRI1-like [Magnolia sinica]
MEFDSSPHTPYPSLGWDFHTFEVFNADMPLAMESSFSSDSSTGYLQDAITEWTSHCKRRRMLLYSHNQTENESDHLIQNYWNPIHNEDPFASFSCFSEDNTIASDDILNSSLNSVSNGPKSSIETKALEVTIHGNEQVSSSPSSYKDSVTKGPDEKHTLVSRDPISSGSPCRRRKRVGKRVAYPFALVKPGGTDDDVTLDDINERILMRPVRPVRHPVGEFACLPCVSADGPGLSGKAVVALTRIHTQGRGTVTIIRTKG